MDCPTCGKALSTERGMRQHHTKVHDEPLPNRTCKGCGTEFYDPKARLTYCDDCDPNAGKHNGNWSGASETSTCKRCGSTFEYYPSNKDGVYCSDCVERADGVLPVNPSTPEDRVKTECQYCGEGMEVLESRLENSIHGVFCDTACYGDWLSENVVGETHHQWEGGSINYGTGWWRIRQQALERDDHECQRCGRDAEDIGRNPDVHHLTPVREFEDPSTAHSLDNVVTLCRRCHRLVEERQAVAPSPTSESNTLVSGNATTERD